MFVWDDGRRLENAANGDQIFTNLDGRTVVTKAKSPPAVAAAVPVRAPCEDEAGIVATNEAGKQLTCAEAKVHCSNVQLAEKCKRTCGLCPAKATPSTATAGATDSASKIEDGKRKTANAESVTNTAKRLVAEAAAKAAKENRKDLEKRQRLVGRNAASAEINAVKQDQEKHDGRAAKTASVANTAKRLVAEAVANAAKKEGKDGKMKEDREKKLAADNAKEEGEKRLAAEAAAANAAKAKEEKTKRLAAEAAAAKAAKAKEEDEKRLAAEAALRPMLPRRRRKTRKGWRRKLRRPMLPAKEEDEKRLAPARSCGGQGCQGEGGRREKAGGGSCGVHAAKEEERLAAASSGQCCQGEGGRREKAGGGSCRGQGCQGEGGRREKAGGGSCRGQCCRDY